MRVRPLEHHLEVMLILYHRQLVLRVHYKVSAAEERILYLYLLGRLLL